MHNRAPLGSPQEPAGSFFANPDFMATFPLRHRLKRLGILDSLGSVGSLGIWLVNDEMKAPRFSSIELKVEGMARRKANHQLLRVPWGRFRGAYDAYPRWQGLALWGELESPDDAAAQFCALKSHLLRQLLDARIGLHDLRHAFRANKSRP
jgi:hypothetical protein